jgi:hypothetical protein
VLLFVFSEKPSLAYQPMGRKDDLFRRPSPHGQLRARPVVFTLGQHGGKVWLRRVQETHFSTNFSTRTKISTFCSEIGTNGRRWTNSSFALDAKAVAVLLIDRLFSDD